MANIQTATSNSQAHYHKYKALGKLKINNQVQVYKKNYFASKKSLENLYQNVYFPYAIIQYNFTTKELFCSGFF